MKILITSGGTKIKIDSVRHIGNMSSGTFGAKIAQEALVAGHDVIFLKAKGSKHPLYPDFSSVEFMTEDYFAKVSDFHFNLIEKYKTKCETIEYSDFYEYAKLVEELTKSQQPDVIILAAAVSDYGVANPVEGKIRSKTSDMTIELKVLPKIISSIRSWASDSFIVGFKLLVGSTDVELTLAATDSLKKNSLDLVVANDLRDIKNNNHKLILVDKNREVEYRQSESTDRNYLAKKVVQRIEEEE